MWQHPGTTSSNEYRKGRACSSPFLVDQPKRQCPDAPKWATLISKYQVPLCTPLDARACMQVRLPSAQLFGADFLSRWLALLCKTWLLSCLPAHVQCKYSLMSTPSRSVLQMNIGAAKRE